MFGREAPPLKILDRLKKAQMGWIDLETIRLGPWEGVDQRIVWLAVLETEGRIFQSGVIRNRLLPAALAKASGSAYWGDGTSWKRRASHRRDSRDVTLSTLGGLAKESNAVTNGKSSLTCRHQLGGVVLPDNMGGEGMEWGRRPEDPNPALDAYKSTIPGVEGAT